MSRLRVPAVRPSAFIGGPNSIRPPVPSQARRLHPRLSEAVQRKLAERCNGYRAARASPDALLTGLIFDDRGNRMSPSHSRKSVTRHRYYVSAALIQGRPPLTSNALSSGGPRSPSRYWAKIKPQTAETHSFLVPASALPSRFPTSRQECTGRPTGGCARLLRAVSQHCQGECDPLRGCRCWYLEEPAPNRFEGFLAELMAYPSAKMAEPNFHPVSCPSQRTRAAISRQSVSVMF
jgi:hypothetical protein